MLVQSCSFIWLCLSEASRITHWSAYYYTCMSTRTLKLGGFCCWHRTGSDNLPLRSTSIGCFYPPFQAVHVCLAVNYGSCCWCTVSNKELISAQLHFGCIYGLDFVGLIFSYPWKEPNNTSVLTLACLAGWLFSWLLNSVEQEVFMCCIHSIGDHAGNTLA